MDTAPPPPCSGTETKPCFIVFEGIDGAGKSTLAKLLARRLADLGIPVLLTAEPSEGPVGQIIRSLTTRLEAEEEARFFTEDRRDHVERVILPALLEGRVMYRVNPFVCCIPRCSRRGSAAILSAQTPLPPTGRYLSLGICGYCACEDRFSRRGRFPHSRLGDLEAVDAVCRSIIDPVVRRIDRTSSLEHIQYCGLQELRCCN
jgi:hypothetical protein